MRIILKEGMFLPLEGISVGKEDFLDNDINIGLLRISPNNLKGIF